MLLRLHKDTLHASTIALLGAVIMCYFNNNERFSDQAHLSISNDETPLAL